MSLVPGRVAVLSAIRAAALFRCSPVPQPEAAPAAQSGLSTVVTQAAPPDEGRRLYEYFVGQARAAHPVVATGEFGADMQVRLVNDGPVTIPLQIT